MNTSAEAPIVPTPGQQRQPRPIPPDAGDIEYARAHRTVEIHPDFDAPQREPVPIGDPKFEAEMARLADLNEQDKARQQAEREAARQVDQAESAPSGPRHRAETESKIMKLARNAGLRMTRRE